MDSNLLTIIGIGLVAMFFGYFFGLFEGRGQGYKRRKTEEAAEKPSTPAPAQTPSPSKAPEPPKLVTPDNSLLRLSLDEDQMPVLEMDGQRADVSGLGPEQRKRLIDLMLVMRPWVDASTPVKPSVPARPATPAIASTPVSAGPRRETDAAAPIAARSPAPAAIASATARPGPEPGSPTTMVGQIDAILQARLTGTELANRAVRLTESPEGGAIIWIGLQRYAGVADVPDPDIKAVIKAAIAEWEEKYTPG